MSAIRERFATRTDAYRPLADRLQFIRSHQPRRWVDIGFLGTKRSAQRTRVLLTRRWGPFGFLFRVADDGRSIETYWRDPR